MATDKQIEAAARAFDPRAFELYDREVAIGRVAENGKPWADVAYKPACDLIRERAVAALAAAEQVRIGTTPAENIEAQSRMMREAANEIHGYVRLVVNPSYSFYGHELAIQAILHRRIEAFDAAEQAATGDSELAVLIEHIDARILNKEKCEIDAEEWLKISNTLCRAEQARGSEWPTDEMVTAAEMKMPNLGRLQIRSLFEAMMKADARGSKQVHASDIDPTAGLNPNWDWGGDP